MAIKTNRNIYIPFFTTEDIDVALDQETCDRKISRSRLIHELLRDALRKLGYKVTGREWRVEE
jgi:bifunctional DNase/RNase